MKRYLILIPSLIFIAAAGGQATSQRDPFMFGETKSAEGGLVLNGIAWDEKAPSAIINGTVVRVGDEVGGSRVVDIQKERVIVSKDGNTYELNLRRGGE